MSRFVQPEVIRLSLSGNDWIDVKKELNVGEQKRLEACGVKRSMFSPAAIDWEDYHVGRVAVWLIDWGGPGFTVDGKSKPLSLDAIRALDQETFDEIQAAISQHVEEQTEAKKARTLATTA